MKEIRKLKSRKNDTPGLKFADFRYTIASLIECVEELQNKLINKPVETTNEQPTFTLNQIKFAFLSGRHYSSNYHISDLLKDASFINNDKNIWDKG